MSELVCCVSVRALGRWNPMAMFFLDFGGRIEHNLRELASDPLGDDVGLERIFASTSVPDRSLSGERVSPEFLGVDDENRLEASAVALGFTADVMKRTFAGGDKVRLDFWFPNNPLALLGLPFKA